MARRRFNRNVREGNFVLLYHATPSKNAQSIYENGLDPERSKDVRGGEPYAPTFLSGELDSAMALLRALIRMTSFGDEEEVIEWFVENGVAPDEAQEAFEAFEEKMLTRRSRVPEEDSPSGLFFHMQLYFHPTQAGMGVYESAVDYDVLPHNEFLWGRPASNFFGNTPVTLIFAFDTTVYGFVKDKIESRLRHDGKGADARDNARRMTQNLKSIDAWVDHPGGIEAGISLVYPPEMNPQILTPLEWANTPELLEEMAEDLDGIVDITRDERADELELSWGLGWLDRAVRDMRT